ncbi:hypothetical protein BGW38_009607, partial [Lunasporangiospora selenospora]
TTLHNTSLVENLGKRKRPTLKAKKQNNQKKFFSMTIPQASSGNETESVESRMLAMMQQIRDSQELGNRRMDQLEADLREMRKDPSDKFQQYRDKPDNSSESSGLSGDERSKEYRSGDARRDLGDIPRPSSGLSASQVVTEANKRTYNGKKFDPKSENVEEWVEYFRAYLSSNIWDLPHGTQNTIAMRMLGQALVGTNEQFWFSQIRQISNDCQDILDELEDNFTPDHIRQKSGTIEDVKDCRQEEDEITRVYLIRFERAVARHRRAADKKRHIVDDRQLIQA